VPFYRVGRGRGRPGMAAAAVIGTFMAAIIGSEGGGNYGRWKGGGGRPLGGSIPREKEGAVSMARQRKRRRRRRLAGAVREEERPGGLRGLKGRTGWRVDGPTGLKFDGKFCFGRKIGFLNIPGH
jgi:hypothetical protein